MVLVKTVGVVAPRISRVKLERVTATVTATVLGTSFVGAITAKEKHLLLLVIVVMIQRKKFAMVQVKTVGVVARRISRVKLERVTAIVTATVLGTSFVEAITAKEKHLHLLVIVVMIPWVTVFLDDDDCCYKP